MAKHRQRIPQDVEAEILFANDRTCCICRDSTKGIQIHHMDRNPNNNDLDNLAVVCTDHHDEIHKAGGITKGISATLLKRYKRNWELSVRRRRTQQHGPLKSSLGIEKTLFEFEIRKTAYEIVALKDNDTEGIRQRLDFLHTLYLMEGYTEQILRDLDHVVVMPALSDQNKASLIADKVHEFFYHLVGPDEVTIKKKDISNLELAIEIIGTIGHFSGEFNKSRKVIKSVSKAFGDLWNIFIWYDLESHALKLLGQIDETSRACGTVYEEDEEPLTSGMDELSKLRAELRTITIEERPKWKKVLHRLSVQDDRHNSDKHAPHDT